MPGASVHIPGSKKVCGSDRRQEKIGTGPLLSFRCISHYLEQMTYLSALGFQTYKMGIIAISRGQY